MTRTFYSLIILAATLLLFSCAGEKKQENEQPGTVPQQETPTPAPSTPPQQPATTTPPADVEVGNEIGNDLGDFVDPDSTLRHLSDLRGKMVMVMLWNSLCHHCVIDNEKHREIYNKYHDKNFVHGIKREQPG